MVTIDNKDTWKKTLNNHKNKQTKQKKIKKTH